MSCPTVIRVTTQSGPPGIGLPAGVGDAGKIVQKSGNEPYAYTLVTPGAASGGTDLSYDPATRVLSSSTGDDVTLPLASATEAGLQTAEHRELVRKLLAAGVDVTGTNAVVIPHIHGDVAGTIYFHVKNTSGGPLTKGTPISVVGAVGDTTTLEVVATDPSTPGRTRAQGLLYADLASNAEGHAVILGELTGVNTAAFAPSSPLWVAATGGTTGTRPASAAQQVATVGRQHASTGTLLVSIQAPEPTAAQIGADPTGTAAGAVAAHVAAADPHSQYTTAAEAAAAAPVQSVAGRTGNVTLSATDVAGLGTAATTDASAYATAAQGAKADTAVQPAALTSYVQTGDSRLSDVREWSAATISQAEAEAGTETIRRAFTAERVRQAVAAWWQAISSSAGRALVTAADAAAQRTALSLGTAALLDHGTSPGNAVRLDPTTGRLPAVDGSQLTNLPSGGTIAAGYAPGTLIGPAQGLALTTGFTNAGVIRFQKIQIDRVCSPTQILTRTATTFQGTAAVLLGIYAHDPTTNRIGDLVHMSSTININVPTAGTSANYGATITGLTLQPGYYWTAHLVVSNTGTLAFLGSANINVGYPTHAEFSTAGSGTNHLQSGTGQTTLPTRPAVTPGAGAVATAFLVF